MALGLVLISSVSCLTAQTNIQLLNYTNIWRYNQSGSNLMTAWRDRTYNDAPAPWMEATGMIGVEDVPGGYSQPISQVLTRPDQGGPITVYMRTHFNFSASLPRTGVVMTAMNFVDDGAVIYLNGAEVYRFRVPTNQIFSTVASGGPAVEGTNEVVTFTPTNLLAGDNVIAVELHQNAAGSSDAVFGMSLTALVPAPLVIVDQPDSILVPAGDPASFTAGVTGSNPYYRWFTNGPSGFVQIPGAAGTNFATYTILSTTTNMSGTQFRVVVTNLLGSVTSTIATLTVVLDTFGPRLAEAILTNSPGSLPNLIHVVFDNPVARISATNHANYAIAILNKTNRVLINTNVSIPYATDTIRITTVTNMDPTNCYVLIVNNVTDIRTNFIAPNSQITLGTYTTNTFVPAIHGWKWNEDNVDLGTAWRERLFNDNVAGWGDGISVFRYDQSPGFDVNFCFADQIMGATSLGPITYYFRAHFNSARAGRAPLRLRYAVDDGAIFYINGVELPNTRVRLPAGSVTHTTLATEIADATNCVTVTTEVTNLLAGDNVMAVEVHQALADNDNDIIMGVEVTSVFADSCPLPVPPRPRMSITRMPPTGLSTAINIRWTNGPIQSVTNNGFALLGSDTVTGPWVEVQPMSTNMVIPLNRARQFYRLSLVRELQ